MKQSFLSRLLVGSALSLLFLQTSCPEVETPEAPEVELPSVSFTYLTPSQIIKLPAVSQTGETPESLDSMEIDIAKIINDKAKGVKLEEMEKIELESASFLLTESSGKFLTDNSDNNWQNFSTVKISYSTATGVAAGLPVIIGSANTASWKNDNNANKVPVNKDVKAYINPNGLTKIYVGHSTNVVKPTTEELNLHVYFNYKFTYKPKK